MHSLELIGLSDDGENLVLAGPSGQRFELAIDEPLRAAIRRDRPRLEQLRADQESPLRPRDIQARIRAGESAQDIASSANLPVENVSRFESAVLAERSFVAEQARAADADRGPGSPTLAARVGERLSARGLSPESAEWDAFRFAGAPWTVQISFDVAGSTRHARWHFDASSRSLTPLDDEARWLGASSEPDGPIPMRRHAYPADGLYDVMADGGIDDDGHPLGRLGHPAGVDFGARPGGLGDHSFDDETEDREDLADVVPFTSMTPDGPSGLAELASAPSPEPSTEDILDALSERRGVRQPLSMDAFDTVDASELFEGFDFESLGPVPGAHPAASDVESHTDATILPLRSVPSPSQEAEELSESALEDAPSGMPPTAPLFETEPERTPTPDEHPKRSAGKSRRPSVPSWDEIVFGAKPE